MSEVISKIKNKMKKPQELDDWRNANGKLAHYFAKRYFGRDCEEWWIAGDIGGIYFINDYFFNPKDMADYIKYDYSRDKMFEHYNYILKCNENGKTDEIINIKSYIKLKK